MCPISLAHSAPQRWNSLLSFSTTSLPGEDRNATRAPERYKSIVSPPGVNRSDDGHSKLPQRDWDVKVPFPESEVGLSIPLLNCGGPSSLLDSVVGQQVYQVAIINQDSYRKWFDPLPLHDRTRRM
jgi:hypothetical protein